jgi:hypothetical protein
MKKKFKPFNQLTKDRSKEISKLFKSRIELYEWQHPIRWCHKYTISKEECKLWLAELIANHAKTPKNTLDYAQYCLGAWGKHFEMTSEQFDKLNDCVNNGDDANQIAFNVLNTVKFDQIELISVDEHYFLKK